MGVPIYSETHGDPGQEAVLLSSGLGGSAGYFAPQIPALSRLFHVIAYDHRGTGRSPDTLDTTHDIVAMARDAIEVLDARGIERAHVVGHALGGLIGLAMAARWPERVGRLVLVNAWDHADSATLRCFAMRTSLLATSGPAAYIRAQATFLYPAAWISANADRLVQDEAHALATFPGVDNVSARIAALHAFDARPWLNRVTAETLVMAAADDVLVPYTRSERLASSLPHARLDLVASGGHAHSLTRAESFNRTLVAFLKGSATASTGPSEKRLSA